MFQYFVQDWLGQIVAFVNWHRCCSRRIIAMDVASYH